VHTYIPTRAHACTHTHMHTVTHALGIGQKKWTDRGMGNKDTHERTNTRTQKLGHAHMNLSSTGRGRSASPPHARCARPRAGRGQRPAHSAFPRVPRAPACAQLLKRHPHSPRRHAASCCGQSNLSITCPLPGCLRVLHSCFSVVSSDPTGDE